MFTEQQIVSIAALAALMGMALWFSLAARIHFSANSPRRPILFALEALSLAICLGTVWIVAFTPVQSLWRAAVALLAACGAGWLFSSALRATSKRSFGVVFGGTVPATIVDHGPYRWIRHPLYVAYLLNWFGCSLLSASPLVWLGTAAVAALYVLAARREERDLLNSSQGPKYAEYRRSTGLFLPRLRSVSKA